MKLKKRTWRYLLELDAYEMRCDKDLGPKACHRITWSEWQGKIWCFLCEKDMEGFGGIFDGPIIWEASKLILGKYCFHRHYLKEKKIKAPFVGKSHNIYYKTDKELTKKLLKPEGTK